MRRHTAPLLLALFAASTKAPDPWRGHTINRYAPMSDVAAVTPPDMGFAETADVVTCRTIGRFNDPGSPMTATNFASPKHGIVMPIGMSQAERLEQYFGSMA